MSSEESVVKIEIKENAIEEDLDKLIESMEDLVAYPRFCWTKEDESKHHYFAQALRLASKRISKLLDDMEIEALRKQRAQEKDI